VIDLHSHILPGLDDGARNPAESLEIARAAVGEGVTAMAATPHVRADFPTTFRQMEWALSALRAELAAAGVALDLLPGAEVALDLLWEIPPADLERLTIAQTGRYLLLEFPYRGFPMVMQTAVGDLARRGITAVIAHPERNPEVQDRPASVIPLVEAGALVQVTAGSVDGRLGASSRIAAEHLLELSLVHLVATDAHGPHIRQGGMRSAVEAIGDERLGRYLTVEAPAAIVAGEPLPALG
jgi:protein-tyrosine phosphatase